MKKDEYDVIELISEDGPQSFEILMPFTFEKCKYAALAPVDDEESAVIMRILEDENGEYFETIEDEMKAQSLFVHFISLWETQDD